MPTQGSFGNPAGCAETVVIMGAEAMRRSVTESDNTFNRFDEFFLILFKILPIGGKTGIPVAGVIFGVQSLIVFSLAAYFMDFTRLYFYAFLFAVSLPVTFWLKKNDVLTYPSLYVFSLTAGPMLVIGWILFVRFLRQFPKNIE